LAPVDRHPAIFIGDESFTVVGVYDDVRRDPELELGIVVPYTTAERRWPNAGANAPLLTMRTEPGAAEVIADQAAIALDPQHPEALRVRPIVTLRSLRRTIDDNLVSLFVTLAGVALVVSTFAAASTASLGVMERRPEIGLRRALGASQASIAGQFLLENVLIGFVGGVAGASLGTIVVVVVGAAHHTQAVLDPQVPLYGPLVGLAAGVLAGLLPAMKAARIDPTTAMRSD
jgi:putative ABC transport system permease protein